MPEAIALFTNSVCQQTEFKIGAVRCGHCLSICELSASLRGSSLAPATRERTCSQANSARKKGDEWRVLQKNTLIQLLKKVFNVYHNHGMSRELRAIMH